MRNVTGREAFRILMRAGVPSRKLIFYTDRQLKTYATIYRHQGEIPEELYCRVG